MVINTFIVKKYAALLLLGFIPTICFVWGDIVYKNYWLSLAMFGGGLLLSFLLANLLLSDPFRKMVEGKGIMLIDLSSTGIVRPLICTVKQPYITWKIAGQWFKDIFNRSTVSNLAEPKVIKNCIETIKEGENTGGIKLEISAEQYNKARFGMWHYPVLFFNGQIGSLITKDWLGEMEKDIFAEHTVLYLNRKMEELSSNVRDFGRYIVEQLRPKTGIWGSKWVWIIIVIFLIIIGVLFAPAIIDAVKGQMGGAVSEVQTTVGGGTITPIK